MSPAALVQNYRQQDDEVERDRRERNQVLGPLAASVSLKSLHERVPNVRNMSGVHGVGLPFRGQNNPFSGKCE